MLFRKRGPRIVPRDEHTVSRREIDEDALKVLYRLSRQGFIAYLVGGGVRDLLLGRKPKDFDVATDAHPNQIKRMFSNCFLVGRRFRLAHIRFQDKVIETSTFRSEPEPEGDEDDLYHHRDNTFGTPEEDARRRDFTVNALFYDIKNFHVIDHVGGLKDLEKGIIRAIGVPAVRFQEDPVRMLRAVRFASRLGFKIESRTRRAIEQYHAEILKASPPRLIEEIFRLFGFGSAEPAFRLLHELGLMRDLLPEVDDYVRATGGIRSPLWAYLAALDARGDAEPSDPAVMLGALMAPLFRQDMRRRIAQGERPHDLDVARQVLEPLAVRLHIPKRIVYRLLFALSMQSRLQADVGRGHASHARFLGQESFPAALILYELAVQAGEADASHGERWRENYRTFLADGHRPHHAVHREQEHQGGGRRRPRRSHRRPRRNESTPEETRREPVPA